MTVLNVGLLPSAPYALAVNDGCYAVNVSVDAYPTSGYIITDAIQHWASHAAGDLYQGAVNTYPPTQPDGCAATVEIYDAPASTTKRIRLPHR